MATNVYTADEVARHRNINDLWVTMNGKVYDLTPFVKQHPGGEEVLLDVAGEDATTCFDSIGHSAEAQSRRDKYMIGELIESETTNQPDQKAERKEATVDDDDWQYEEPKQEKSFYIPLCFIAITIAIYAVIIGYFW